MTEAELISARRHRGTVRSRLTKVEKDVIQLEQKVQDSDLESCDQKKIKRLREEVIKYDRDFEERHLEVLDSIDESAEDTLEAEERVFDQFCTKVRDLQDRLEKLEVSEDNSASSATALAPASFATTLDPASSATASNPSSKLTKRLRHLEQQKQDIQALRTLLPVEPEADTRLRLQNYLEDILALKARITGLEDEILSSTIEDTSPLMDKAASIKKDLANEDFEVKRLLRKVEDEHKTPVTHKEAIIELPRISAPTFDGNILNWVTFWEQFKVAIHSNDRLHDAQKFVYLREAVKDGSANQVIQGISHSAGSYNVAVDSLRKRYDRPRHIHKNHVQALVDTPNIRTGSGKELRQFHDVFSRHVRSLRMIKGDTFDTFVSAFAEMKLDQESKFAWQTQTQEKKDVPSIDELLNFIDRRAEASELSTPQISERKPPPLKRETKMRASYQVTIERKCVGCNEETHFLHTCSTFRSLTPVERLAIAKKYSLCLNCLRQGHFASQCQLTQRCKKCKGKHHTLLHLDDKAEPTLPKSIHSKKSPTEKVINHIANGKQGNVLLATCQVMVQGPGGTKLQARALLDSGSETSFITERLAQQLRLTRRRSPMVACLGGVTPQIKPKGLVTVRVTGKNRDGKTHTVDAIVLRRITSDIPAAPVQIKESWTHLSGLHLADPDYGISKSIDLLLGADVFGCVVLHGRRFGPSGTPSAFKTQFGWVLIGATGRTHGGHRTAGSCHLTTTVKDQQGYEFQKRFGESNSAFPKTHTTNRQENDCGALVRNALQRRKGKSHGTLNIEESRSSLTCDLSNRSPSRKAIPALAGGMLAPKARRTYSS